MVKSIKKLLSICMVLVLVIGLLIACSQNEGETGTTAPENSTTESGDKAQTGSTETSSSGPEPLILPIVKKPITLSMFWGIDAKALMSMQSYDEIACFKEMEKKSGINIEWIHPPTGQETEQFNLMMASQDLPDMIYWDWRNIPGGPAKAIQDGNIVKLNDLIDKYAPNMTKVYNEHPEWRKEATLDDGTLYMFPFIREDKQLRLSSAFQIRKDWVDKLGLKVPTTIDEWYDALAAIKQKDPNGNAQADELPFVSAKAGGLQNFEYAYGIRHNFYQENGKVKYGPAQPAYKDYLVTMAKWYKEGLIDPDYASTDGKSFDAKVTGDKGGSYFGMVSGNMGRFTDLVRPKNPNFKMAGAPFPKGPAGKSYGTLDFSVVGGGAAISAKSKYQKEAAKWLDYWYSDEGHMLINFGIEGESYTLVNGEPVYTDKVLKNPDLPVPNALIQYAMSISSGPFVQDKRYLPQILPYPEQMESVNTWLASSDPSLLLPPITPTQEESTRLAAIMGDITTYVNEMFDKFVMGQESLDNFDKYAETVKSMGIDEAIQIQQTALDRYNAR